MALQSTKGFAPTPLGLALATGRIHPTAILQGDIQFGDDPFVGYYSIVRGKVRAGRNLRLGSHASIEGDVLIGDDVTIRGKCEIPNSTIGDRVSIYAGTKFYDTPRLGGPNVPPVIEDDVVIGCDSAILGGVTVGARSIIGARCFITEDVPPDSYVTCVSEVRVRPLRK